MQDILKQYSILAIIVSILFAIVFRIEYHGTDEKPLRILSWDAAGYYAYLPAEFIYNDVEKMEWFDAVKGQYDLSHGDTYQFSPLDNGNRVGKYLVGVSVLQTPFFFIGHIAANFGDHKADGFSPPYQYAIAYGAIFYLLIGLILIRKTLLRYFSETITAISIILLVFGTNLLQYSAIEGGMPHIYLFFLYALTIYLTLKWHEKPSFRYSALLGLAMGLATICRPTDLLIIFIPILWNIHNKESRIAKWTLIKKEFKQLIWTAAFFAIGVLPQITYWFIATGSPLHTVGSKWQFLNPWFRVLFGFENGWFIYTPITLFFIVGLFFLKNRPFKLALIVFTLLNIWVIISWHEWKYGATYSTRALVQSYPLLILALAAVLERIQRTKIRLPFLALSSFLIFLNVFQLNQYNQGILSGRDMNYAYYKAIFLETSPTALDMSFLDTEEEVQLDKKTWHPAIHWTDSTITATAEQPHILYNPTIKGGVPEMGIIVKCEGSTVNGIWDSYFKVSYSSEKQDKERLFRLKNPLTKPNEKAKYEFGFAIPQEGVDGELTVSLVTESFCEMKIDKIEIFAGQIKQ